MIERTLGSLVVALAFLVLGADRFATLASLREGMAGFSASYYPGLLIYPVMIYLLVFLVIAAMLKKQIWKDVK